MDDVLFANTRAVLLDVDGTLVDTNYLHTLAWSRALRRAGEWAPMNAIHRLIGMGADQLLPRLIGRFDEQIADSRPQLYAELADEAAPFPGAHQLVATLKNRRIAVVLATSSPQRELDRAMAILDIGELVDCVTTADDVQRSKPDPQIFEVARQGIGADPDDTVVIGDSIWDIEAATSAGLRCIALESGGFSRAELAQASAVFRDVAQLDDHLAGRLSESSASAPAQRQA